MKIKTILFTSLVCLCISDMFAQEKITIVAELTTTTIKYFEGGQESRTSARYYFKLGDDPKIMSTGKRGRDLRKHIKDEEALKYFDKSMKQVRWGNATSLGMLGGLGLAAAGFANPIKKIDDQGYHTGNSVNPLLILGGATILGSIIARPILFKKFDKNFAKSIELHNNTVLSDSSQNIRIDNVGFTLDNRTSRPQLYLSWRF